MKFLFGAASLHLDFLWVSALYPSSNGVAYQPDYVRWCHVVDPKHEGRFDWLTGKLRRAPAVTPDLISNVIVDACTRLLAVNATRVDQLIEVGAWTDAALALIELELPAWKLRRLIYEEGAWFCSLSREPNLPVEFDDTADASTRCCLWRSWVRSLKRGAGLALYANPVCRQCPQSGGHQVMQSVATISAEQLQGQPPCDEQSLPRVARSSLLLIGQNSGGNWVVQDPRGLRGGTLRRPCRGASVCDV